MLETILTWIAVIILAGLLLEVVICIAIVVVWVVTMAKMAKEMGGEKGNEVQ